MLRGRVGSGLWAAVLVVGSVKCLDGQAAQSVQAMAKDAHPAFEVAAIKRSDPDDKYHRFEIHGRRIVIENQTVRTMIEMSYGVHARQIVNAPSWMELERFDVEGVPDVEGQPNVTQFQEIVRKLLEERFGLKFHNAKQEMSRYVLTVAKGGPKMEATKRLPDALPNIRAGGDKTSHSLQMENVSTGDLAHQLQGQLDRPVVDETGLQGRYDLTMKWSRTDAAVAAEDADNTLPGLFTALQEQAGLKVEPSRGEVDVMVIERAEQPSAN